MRGKQLQYVLAIVAGGVIELNGVVQLLRDNMGLGIASLIVGGAVTVVGAALLLRRSRPGGG